MTTLSEFQIAEAALIKVLAALPYDRSLLEQLTHTALPFLYKDGTIQGPAQDNAAVFVQYPGDWTGLAVSYDGGKWSFWFFYLCDYFRERATACLGSQPSPCAAIDAAVQHVKSDLKRWNGHKLSA